MNFNLICEEMKKRIEKEYQSSSDTIDLGTRDVLVDEYTDEEYYEEQKNEKTLNLSKLADVLALTSQSVETQKKFINFKEKVEGYNLRERQKIQFILTSAGLLNRYGSYILTTEVLLNLVLVSYELSTMKLENNIVDERIRFLLGLNSKGDFPKPDESEKTK